MTSKILDRGRKTDSAEILERGREREISRESPALIFHSLFLSDQHGKKQSSRGQSESARGMPVHFLPFVPSPKEHMDRLDGDTYQLEHLHSIDVIVKGNEDASGKYVRLMQTSGIPIFVKEGTNLKIMCRLSGSLSQGRGEWNLYRGNDVLASNRPSILPSFCWKGDCKCRPTVVYDYGVAPHGRTPRVLDKLQAIHFGGCTTTINGEYRREAVDMDVRFRKVQENANDPDIWIQFSQGKWKVRSARKDLLASETCLIPSKHWKLLKGCSCELCTCVIVEFTFK